MGNPFIVIFKADFSDCHRLFVRTKGAELFKVNAFFVGVLGVYSHGSVNIIVFFGHFHRRGAALFVGSAGYHSANAVFGKIFVKKKISVVVETLVVIMSMGIKNHEKILLVFLIL